MNDALAFLNESSLNTHDFNDNTEFLIDRVFTKNLITLFYADGGNGKSWLAFSLAKHCAKLGLKTVYLDFDNPLNVLKERNINTLLVQSFSNINYVQRGKCRLTPQELLIQLNEQAVSSVYKDYVFIIDSLRNFTNVNHDAQAMETMNQIMNLREAGATVAILHHSNKDGKNYQGSNNIRNSIDNMYQVNKLESTEHCVNLHLQVKKERANIVDVAYSIDTRSLELTQLDEAAATMSAEVEAFVGAVKEALSITPNINKSMLLEAVGRKKDDKTARGWLDEFDGKYWNSEKTSGVFTYRLIDRRLEQGYKEEQAVLEL